MALDPQVDQIRFYQKKQNSDQYIRYVYKVTKSFQTTPQNVQVLLPQ